MTNHAKATLAMWAPVVVMLSIFLGVFCWAAARAEDELAAKDAARASCITDIECCTAWSDCAS